MALPCVLALGRTRLLFGVSTAYALVHIPIFVIGTLRYGLLGSIWSLVLAGVVYTWLNAWMLQTTLGVTATEIVRQLMRPGLATTVMVVGVLALSRLASVDQLSPLPSLAVKSLVGAALFVSSLYALWRLTGCPSGIESRLLQLWRQARVSS